ncbi:glycosyltransferase family 4 protein [Thioclava pacifica]|uniref:Glycosyltransferase subfamily 4-like N-terminal domain-containing protein n=1 Tax=Thioclava pacifica DSM 10166 TaxID=1353537 RepID=A0A074JFQ7_9RHOB|nr:glycosyltransferase family 4 protein [Thioclava pacifica]KEO54700.1 hypothetical protein TP2_17345 [Thioclava pacifica DSM 10166]
MRLAYVVTEAGCMDPTTGASQHIAMGMRELGKRTELVPFVPPVPKPSGPARVSAQGGASPLARLSKTGVWGAARDLRDVWRMVQQGRRLAREIDQAGCSVAYVRVQGLHPVSLFLRRRGVKVVLEANGLQHVSRQSRFRSLLSGLYRPFERYVYREADHVFFVGSYGQYWQLDTANWTEVENGVEPNLFTERQVPVGRARPLRLVLLARLVGHHKAHLLPEAFALLDPDLRDQIELHLVGSGFEQLKEDLRPLVRVEDHGFVSRDAIGDLMQRMDCGVIPDCPPYGSQMKLLDYAASGCLVLAPDVIHLVNFFADKGVLFFNQGDAASLADRIRALIAGEVPTDDMARAMQDHVRGAFTWDAIFERKWTCIAALAGQDATAGGLTASRPDAADRLAWQGLARDSAKTRNQNN